MTEIPINPNLYLLDSLGGLARLGRSVCHPLASTFTHGGIRLIGSSTEHGLAHNLFLPLLSRNSLLLFQHTNLELRFSPKDTPHSIHPLPPYTLQRLVACTQQPLLRLLGTSSRFVNNPNTHTHCTVTAFEPDCQPCQCLARAIQCLARPKCLARASSVSC